MTPTELRLRTLAQQAHRVLTKLGKSVPIYTGLPKWPSQSVSPVWIIPQPEVYKLIGASPLHRAIGLRQKYDPDEQSLWVFTPAGDGSDEVWLVRTKRTQMVDPSNN